MPPTYPTAQDPTASDPTTESALFASPFEAGAAPRRVLIVLLGAIGDVVRALPLLGRLRRSWPASPTSPMTSSVSRGAE